jgi:small conductance mechanosensitive channel
MEQIKAEVLTFLTEYGFRIVGALLIIVAGALVARWVGRVCRQALEKKQVEPPIIMLTVRVLRLLAFGLAVVLALDKCGVPIAPMVAGISVIGVGLGLAMQGVLSNIVAGLTIIFIKPFRVGQYIEIAGEHGQVQSIDLFTSTLIHPDQSRVVIPNRKIVGEILHNYGAIRQLDLSVGVSYSTNVNEAIDIIRQILAENPRVLKQPAAGVGISSLGDSSVNIAIKPWATIQDFGAAGGEINKAILERFREKQIEIPFPQREIRLLNAATTEVGRM